MQAPIHVYAHALVNKELEKGHHVNCVTMFANRILCNLKCNNFNNLSTTIFRTFQHLQNWQKTSRTFCKTCELCDDEKAQHVLNNTYCDSASSVSLECCAAVDRDRNWTMLISSLSSGSVVVSDSGSDVALTMSASNAGRSATILAATARSIRKFTLHHQVCN